MAEIHGSEELLNQPDSSGSTILLNQPDSSGSTIPLNQHDYIDLTESDDFQTPLPSVSSSDYSATISPEKNDVQSNSAKRALVDSESLDESFSIVYENIKPQPELQVVDLSDVTDDIVVQLLKEDSTRSYGHISRKVKIGSKSVNLSVSISTKGKESTTNVKIMNRMRPEIQEVESIVAKPETSTKIECGICLDAVDEISASERKLLSTVCGHVFCCACFTKSMANSRLCPKCRKRLTKKQVHPLYL